MPSLRKIRVRTPSKQYDVLCGVGALSGAAKHIACLGPATGVFLLTSPKVWSSLRAHLQKSIVRPLKAKVVQFDDREVAKNLATVERVCRQLARAGADRKCTLVAVGGGVVGDVAGFVGASFLRGVRLVHVPTTLVAQVDSAIGGKTGVNLPEGKNLAGAFYQPDLVLADPATLKTLPDRDYRSGIYEVIKYGVIGDVKLFAQLERDLGKLLRREPQVLSTVIPRCIALKARVTVGDEKESGLREILNFGHTLGHALESVTRYKVFRHGEAVGWGMIVATAFGIAAINLAISDAVRVIRLVRRVGALPPLPKVPAAQIVAAMLTDKKTRGGTLRFVLPTRIGSVKHGVELPESLIEETWAEVTASEGA
ncbi:MAG TPA: 3-dehydroquinate synthase [Candidatus Acidoferrum sp.]|nr:3-dehydroquinate synthase [Candidatus Acidoferrum sp.]